MSEDMKLDAVSVDPLYRQLLIRLRGAIMSGEYPVDSRMPSEKELCETYGISRVTVRRTLKELTDEGLIVRHQGKGSFVSRPRLERNLGNLKGFTELCAMFDRKPSTRVVKVHEVAANQLDESFLKQPEGSPVLEVIRVRMADGEPVSLERAHFPMTFQWLMREDLSKSLFQILRTRGLAPGKTGYEISLCFADHQASEQLGVEAGTALLSLTELVCDQSGNPMILCSQRIRGDRFTFRI